MGISYHKELSIALAEVKLQGELCLPEQSKAIIIFSHGSGSSRLSKRNQFVARYLNEQGFGTLLFDLLTSEEDQDYENRFDIDLLTERLVSTSLWLEKLPEAGGLFVGYFGASTGAASALKAASVLQHIFAVVSRGGRPDLAMDELPDVKAPTLLIVGSLDQDVLDLNQKAYLKLNCEKRLDVVDGATHLFEEEGKLEQVAELASCWFKDHIQDN
ncbi:MAG: dienelactone hydrolase family protein [Pedobacter sp.]|jgi:predicted alpha/beta-hydrolase family hydrolase